MKHRTGSNHCHAFTLMDMIAVLSLMAIIITVGGRLFMQSLSVVHATQKTDVVVSQRQDFMHTLRADVWTAVALHPVDDQTIEIQHGNGDRVRWRHRIDEEMLGNPAIVDRSVQRDGSWQVDRQWRDTRWQITFTVMPTALVMHVVATDHLPSAQWLMPAALLLQREPTP